MTTCPQSTPMTESSNPITLKLDLSTPQEMVQLFKRCDLEVIRGPENGDYTTTSLLTSSSLHDNIAKVAQKIKSSPKPLIVFTGCGTSGRLGYVAATEFTESGLLPHATFKYLIAGADKALLTSQEAHEDKPLEGIADLESLIEKHAATDIILVAITCGMSAPYVAGQLDYALKNDKFTPVLIGFNPVENARKIPIPTWNNRTFHSVAQELAASDKAIIINPPLGGEHVSGSSRMKGGSGTKIILDTIFLTAVSEAPPAEFIKQTEADVVEFYRQNGAEIARLIEHGGATLMRGESITYFGRTVFGALGLIDGTECKPTYGATLDDVRGFVEGGFSAMKNNDGDISHYGSAFQVSFQDFQNLGLTAGTSLVLNEPDHQLTNLPERLNTPTSSGFLLKSPSEKTSPVEKIAQKLRNELLTKLGLNCISTGAHVLKGKVMQNFMIDVALTNLKLFIRGREMIRRFVPGLSVEEAVGFMLRGIYNVDDVPEDVKSRGDEDHVQAATAAAVELGLCVPVAIILAAMHKAGKDSFGCADARAMLQKQPRIRQTLKEVLGE